MVKNKGGVGTSIHLPNEPVSPSEAPQAPAPNEPVSPSEAPAYEPKVKYKHFLGGSGVVNVSLTVDGESAHVPVSYDKSTGVVTDVLTDEMALQLTETTFFNLIQ